MVVESRQFRQFKMRYIKGCKMFSADIFYIIESPDLVVPPDVWEHKENAKEIAIINADSYPIGYYMGFQKVPGLGRRASSRH